MTSRSSQRCTTRTSTRWSRAMRPRRWPAMPPQHRPHFLALLLDRGPRRACCSATERPESGQRAREPSIYSGLESPTLVTRPQVLQAPVYFSQPDICYFSHTDTRLFWSPRHPSNLVIQTPVCFCHPGTRLFQSPIIPPGVCVGPRDGRVGFQLRQLPRGQDDVHVV
jgi:hypothetical protein